MRYGFTTGSCSAAAAKAAAYMLLTGREKRKIAIDTPKGIRYETKVVEIKREEKKVSCAVIKDGGDDPDITTGAHVTATVSFLETEEKQIIRIEGGKGVGVVTKPGLDQPVGNAAINRVPRAMIQKEVSEVCQILDYKGSLLVEISVPEGEALASQTFNPRLGIEGGISILGTSGIVEPMSSQALIDTIRVELSQKKAEGKQILAVSPGNYGLEYMKRTYGYDLDKSVKCSNFIGQTIDMAVEMGFSAMLLTGHIGKLIKVSGGIMNTHSKEGDCRMELLVAAALRAGAGEEVLRQVLDAATTEEAVRILKEQGLCEKTMELIMERIMFYLKKRAAGKMEIACMMYSNDFGGLGESANARAMLEQILKEKD